MNAIVPKVILPFREVLPLFLNDNHWLGKGAEVGVQKGLFSEIILTYWKGEVLYSIDPWKEFEETLYPDNANVSQAEQDAIYQEAVDRLSPFGERSRILRKTSEEASKAFEAESLDFVYIDAQHTYQAVSRDIRLWYPKIKKGGLICGHDYIPDSIFWYGIFGVQSAVNQFAANRGLEVLISGEKLEEQKVASWFIIKP